MNERLKIDAGSASPKTVFDSVSDLFIGAFTDELHPELNVRFRTLLQALKTAVMRDLSWIYDRRIRSAYVLPASLQSPTGNDQEQIQGFIVVFELSEDRRWGQNAEYGWRFFTETDIKEPTPLWESAYPQYTPTDGSSIWSYLHALPEALKVEIDPGSKVLENWGV